MILEGDLVRLEPLELAHVPALVAAASESRDEYGYTWVPENDTDMRAYVEEALHPDNVAFATRSLSDGRIVGTTRFKEVSPWVWPPGHPLQRQGRPDVVWIGNTWLAASAQRTGINAEAKRLMLVQAFDGWDVHAVRLRTDVRNTRSRRAIERLGAQFEGVRRADGPGADGAVRDSAVYSIVREEWPAVRAQLYSRSTM